MKTNISLIITLSFLIVSCNNDDEKSIAYGNFESDVLYISAKSNGELIESEIEKGQKLTKGQVVGIIDTTAINLQKESLIAKRDRILLSIDEINAQIKLVDIKKENLKTNYKRISNLLKNQAATQEQFDNIETELKATNQQVNQLTIKKRSVVQDAEVVDKQIDLLKYQIVECEIINPINGTVLNEYVSKNELCIMGKPIYKIANIKLMTLKAYISAHQLSNTEIGEKLKVTIDGSDGNLRYYDGVVSWISSEAEFTPKTIQTPEERLNLVYAIEIQVENDGKIKIGMPGEVHFKYVIKQ